jgi:NitT/TauT family transport system ATP-binding protein
VKPALVAEGIRHVYRGSRGDLLALDGVGLTVRKGEFVTIVGSSGCGKSTLLRILGGLLVPTEGSVHLDGNPLSSPRRHVGYVFQKPNLLPWRTALGNIVLPLEVAGLSGAQAKQRALDLLDLVGLKGFETAYPRQLSGGMAQRAAIARALVAEPEVLLLDEPFGSLDALSRDQMNLELLRIWQARQVTAVMVTHSLQEAIFVADRVLVMSPRPGQIRTEVQVKLERPRTLGIIYSEGFRELSCQVRDAIGS